MKKIAISLLLFFLIFQSACDSQSNNNEDIQPIDNIHYNTEFLTDINLIEILKFSDFDDKLAIIGSFMDEKKSEAIKAIIYDEDGNQLSEIVFKQPNNTENSYAGWSDDVYIDENGFIWILYSQLIETDGVLGCGGSFIDCYDQSGNHVKTVKLLTPQPYLYKSGIRDFLVADDGCFYICTDNGYTAVFDSVGNLIYEPKNLRTIFKLPDGVILAETKEWDVDGATIFREIKAMEQELGESLPLDTTWNYNNTLAIYYMKGDDEYTFLESTHEKIFGYNLKTDTRVELIDRAKQHIIESRGSNKHVVMLNSNIFVVETYIAPEAGQKGIGVYTLIRLKKSDTPSNANKKVITLATLHDMALKGSIIDFNRNNSEYIIEIKNYSKAGRGIIDAVAELNLDLASGKIPDILMISPMIPISSYGEKGFLVDLYEYIDKDPDMERDDYLPNILKMHEINGKLYSIGAGFEIHTVLCPASIFNENIDYPKLTWDDFAVILDENSNVTVPIASKYAKHMSRRYLIQNAILLEINDYNNFNTPEFISLLENIYKYIPDPYIDAIFDDYQEGNILFRNDVLIGFLEAKIPELFYFGEPISYVGFPTTNGINGSFATLTYPMAIFEQSEVKDGAWEYLKSILTDFQFTGVDYGAGLDKNGYVTGFPIHRLALNQMAEAVKVSADETFTRTIGSITLTYDPVLTNEDVDKILELIVSLEYHDAQIDRGVMEIVLEETDYYFAGQKTAEEVADIIQSRVNIYLAEID